MRPSPPYIIDAVVQARDDWLSGKEERDRQEALEAERLARKRMLEDRIQAWMKQGEDVSILDQLAREAGARIYAIADVVGRQGYPLRSSDSRKLKGDIDNWLKGPGLFTTGRMDMLMVQVLDHLRVPAKKRDVNALRVALGSLAAEMEKVGKEVKNPAHAVSSDGLIEFA